MSDISVLGIFVADNFYAGPYLPAKEQTIFGSNIILVLVAKDVTKQQLQLLG